MSETGARDWAVVGPWWKWSDPKSKLSGRVSRPVFQKYDTADLANAFLKDPQRCLAFVDEDIVHVLQAPATPDPGLPRRFGKNLDYVKDPSNTRKIFLDTHRRFYLVVCEIHCDEPGFPSTSRDRICDVGFVVRRRTVAVPAAGLASGGAIVKDLGAARTKLAVLDKLASDATAEDATLLSAGKVSSLAKKRASVQAILAVEKARFNEWVDRFKVTPTLQGWLPSASGGDRTGRWAEVEETPDDLGDEVTFPMYPLVPAGSDTQNAGNFGTIYFGILPTGSADIEEGGRPRFDDQQFYEVRVFAKRHGHSHPRGAPCKCPEKTFFSLPTEVYKLAPHFDLVGTSNRPVTIQLPDLDVLAAQAKPSLGVGLAKPPGYPNFSVDSDGKPSALPPLGFPEICTFAIPVITIVATFLFQLFLPIVTLLFGLFFLLKLKFCIPPEVSVSAGISAELKLDATAAEEAAAALVVNPAIEARFPDVAATLEATYSPIANGNMELALERASDPATTPSVSANLVWETEVPHA